LDCCIDVARALPVATLDGPAAVGAQPVEQRCDGTEVDRLDNVHRAQV
jgi:hypothetical protein